MRKGGGLYSAPLYILAAYPMKMERIAIPQMKLSKLDTYEQLILALKSAIADYEGLMKDIG